MPRLSGLFAGSLVVCVLGAAQAQENAPVAAVPLAIPPAHGSILIDGELSDAGWADAAVIDRFYETSPGNNVPPRVRTSARITFDQGALYIAVDCEDPEPSRIHAPFVERDSVLGTDDNVAIFLDTRNDRRSAIELRVSARGIQGDAIYNDANGNEDFSPDFFYDSAARITPRGWTAELRIPFSSLRYGSAPLQTWGLLIWRNYPRDYRYFIQSSPIPRESTCLICHAQPITLEGLPAAGHTIAAPYAASRFEQTRPDRSGKVRTQFGGDVKWNPGADQAVDVTINPDFSQLESDVAQITANQRFALFFPEKRPFFLEGLDLFDTPLQVAYTRTITSPLWGVRSTGKLGSSAYTALASEDRGGGEVILPGATSSDFAPQDFHSLAATARVRRDLGSSFTGLVITDREVKGGGYNRVLGPDFQWRRTNDDSLTGQLLYSGSETPNRPDLSSAWRGERLTSWAGVLNWNHQAAKYDCQVKLQDVGSAFRADDGFVPQVGYRELEVNGAYRAFPTHSLFSYVRTYFWGDVQTDQHGAVVFQKQNPGIYLEGKKGLVAGLAIHPAERYRAGSRLLTASFAAMSVQFNPSRTLAEVSASVRGGEGVDFEGAKVGRLWRWTASAKVRAGDRLSFDMQMDRQQLAVGGIHQFTAHIERLKATYSFSERSMLRAVTQLTSNARKGEQRQGSLDGSILYSYRVNWQTVLFAGLGDARVLSEQEQYVTQARSIFVKVSYALQR